MCLERWLAVKIITVEKLQSPGQGERGIRSQKVIKRQNELEKFYHEM